MTTGARRGELCALRWSSVSLDEGRETVWLRRAIRRSADGLVEGDLKTHQQRRVALDAETAAVLLEHRERCSARDRKSTRLNSSHANISYAVFCLKKKNIKK